MTARPSRARVFGAVAITLVTALLVTALLVPAGAQAQRAPDRIRIKVGKLEAGSYSPFVHEATYHDGEHTVTLDSDWAWLMGRDGADAIVGGIDDKTSRYTVYRIDAAGVASAVMTWKPSGMLLSEDGETVYGYTYRFKKKKTVVEARSTTDGSSVGRRSFRGLVDLLAARGDDVYLNSDHLTVRWDLDDNSKQRFLDQGAYRVDIGADRVARFTTDPFDGGCSVVSRLSKPRKVLSRSCSSRVEAFSPNGHKMATVGILSDGLGPREAELRRTTGRVLARYRAPLFFGFLRFDDNRRLLLETSSWKRAALVSCGKQSCERASDVVTTDLSEAIRTSAWRAARSR